MRAEIPTQPCQQEIAASWAIPGKKRRPCHERVTVMPGAGSFLPHATCYLFNSRLMWLHGASDGVIALAYYAIPLEILYFASRRRDLPFPMVFVAFAVFILGC